MSRCTKIHIKQFFVQFCTCPIKPTPEHSGEELLASVTQYFQLLCVSFFGLISLSFREALLKNQVTVNRPKSQRPHSHLVKHHDVIAGRIGPQELKSRENLSEIAELVIPHGNDQQWPNRSNLRTAEWNVFKSHNLKAGRKGSWGEFCKTNRHHTRYNKKRVERR